MRTNSKLTEVERLMRSYGWERESYDGAHSTWKRGDQVTTIAHHGKRVGAHMDQIRRQLRRLDAERSA